MNIVNKEYYHMETLLNQLFAKRTELRLKQQENPSDETQKELKLVQQKIEDLIYDWSEDSFGL